MKKFITLVTGFILMAAILLSSCGGGGSGGSGGEAPPSTLDITFSNGSNYIFNEIYISPTAANDWGSELLGSTSVLKSNGSIDVEIPAYDFDNYDIRIIDEDRDEYSFQRIPLQDGCEVAIYFGDIGLAVDVYNQRNELLVTAAGVLNGGDGAVIGDGRGDFVEEVLVGAGYDSEGYFSFAVYNETSYTIVAIYMGLAEGYSAEEFDVLPGLLYANDSVHIENTIIEEFWGEYYWTLYVVDDEGDTSVNRDVFDPWSLSYVDINWDSGGGGYVCEFNY